MSVFLNLFYQYRVGGSLRGFLISSSPKHNPFSRQDFAEKNTSGAKRAGKIFFQQTPKGPGLDGKGLFEKFAYQKG